MNSRTRAWLFGVTLCVAAVVPATVSAQATTSIRGTVSDQTAAVVPGVNITFENLGTGAVRETVTDDAGSYQILQIPPGTYRIRAALTGFNTVVRDNLQLLVNTPMTLNLQFEQVGQVAENVEVIAAAAPLLNTVDATVGQTIQNRQIVDLPLEGRNVAGLLSLQPGVTFSGAGDTRGGAVSGARSDQSNVTVDGIDANDQLSGSAFTSVLPVTLDSVQELRVVTANANASQGRSSGGQVALVTKSGTNQPHGSAYEYHRNTVTTANDFFNNRVGVAKPKLNRNVFGGSLGGPVKKDRLFFFFNYEGTQERRGQNVLRTVPTESAKQGMLKYRRADGSVGTLTPEEIRQRDPLGIGSSPAILALMAQYPAGNDPSGGDGNLNSMGLRFVAPMERRDHTYIARVDYSSPNGKNLVFFRAAIADWSDDSGPPQFLGQPSASKTLTTNRGFAAGHTWTLSNTLINDLRYGVTRQGNNLQASSTRPAKLTLGGVGSGYSDLESWATQSVARYTPVYNLTDDVTKITGRHTIQFGGNLRWIRNQRIDATRSTPSFRSDPAFLINLGRGQGVVPADVGPFNLSQYTQQFSLMLGALSVANATYFYGTDGLPFAPPHVPDRTFANNEYEVYVQDQWRVTSDLTLTAGLRYGYYAPPYEVNGYEVRPTLDLDKWWQQRANGSAQGIPSNQNPLLAFQLGGKANNAEPFYEPDKNNFAPRISAAWAPNFKTGFLHTLFGDAGASSIRGGAAMFYERIGGGLGVSADTVGSVGLASNAATPTALFDYATAPRFTGLGSLPTLMAMNAPAPPGGFPSRPAAVSNGSPIVSLQGFVNNTSLRTPYSYTFNVSVGRELPGGFNVEGAFVKRVGRKLLAKADYAAVLVNFRDPRSGQTWEDAMRLLEPAINGRVPAASVQAIPFFENIFAPMAGGGLSATQAFYNAALAAGGWANATTLMRTVDINAPNGSTIFGRATFFQPQFDALYGWTNWGEADYDSLQLMMRKRFRNGLQADFNYTLSNSMDNGSAVEFANSTTIFSTSAGLIFNPFRPGDSYARSDFDVRHQINANFVAELPFGRDRWLGRDMPAWAEALAGGWQITGLIRWRQGFPLSVGNGFAFPTNYFIPTPATLKSGSDAPEIVVDKSRRTGPNAFADPAAAYSAFRNTSSGSAGSRNVLTGPDFFTIDAGLHKSFRVAEGQRLVFRWETFNVTNRTNFGGISASIENPNTFGNYTSTTGGSRVMQFALRYEF